ncbi:MAG: hydrolase [Candidatus Neomarinimicrobiota bacterium]|nr:MAG: hydrolase [Candidatus Neomarinimicrobiota bacterium]
MKVLRNLDVFFVKNHSQKRIKKNLVLYRGMETFILMNLYPYTNGHLMIAPYLHTSDVNELTEIANKEIMQFAKDCFNILKSKLGAEGFNFGANLGKVAGAGIDQHIHYHIVPRWSGDTNFMPVISDTKVMIEKLNKTWERLKPEFS